MTIEQLLAVAVPITVILGPLFAMLMGIGQRLAKIEQQLKSEGQRVDEILARHDKNIHEIRNALHLISLQIAAKEKHHE